MGIYCLIVAIEVLSASVADEVRSVWILISTCDKQEDKRFMLFHVGLLFCGAETSLVLRSPRIRRTMPDRDDVVFVFLFVFLVACCYLEEELG